MIELTLTEKEFEEILKSLKFSNSELYAKLWAYKINLKLNKK